MKAFLCLVLILFTTVSCNSYAKYVNSDIGCDFDQTITKDEFTIDTNYFDSIIAKEPKEYRYSNILYFENKGFKKEINYFSSKPLSYLHTIINKNTNIIKRLKYDSIGRLIQSKFRFIVYQDDSNLRRLSIGNEYEYNPSTGEIKNTIDHRDAVHYKICYKEALAIVEQLKPKKHYISAMSRRTIESDSGAIKKYVWRVFVDEPKNSKTYPKTFIYVIDANTGELIRKNRYRSNPS